MLCEKLEKGEIFMKYFVTYIAFTITKLIVYAIIELIEDTIIQLIAHTIVKFAAIRIKDGRKIFSHELNSLWV